MKTSVFYATPQHLKRQPKRRMPFIAVIAIAVIALGVLVWFLMKGTKTDANITYVGDIPVVRSYIPEGASSRPGTKRTIKHIVMHETDNFRAGADAKAHNAFLLSQAQTQELSWHYTVDDHEIYHNLPDDEAAYHASDKMEKNGGNLNGIGVELCVNEDGDYEQTIENGALLVATLMREYGLKIDDVKKHQDFSPNQKVCPARLIENERWDTFLARVQEFYKELDAEQAK